jgi:PadR family transcriptional regulator, regulatory protein PadR
MRRSLGEFEQLILLALVDVGEDQAYGVPIRESIERRTARRPAMGAVYTALDRLEARGFVSSRLGPATAERGGRAKRFYRLLPAGSRALADSIRVLRDMSNGLLHRLDPQLANGTATPSRRAK